MFVCTKNTVCISYNYIDTRYALATWRSRNNIAIAMYGATTTGWLRYRYIQRKKKYLCIQSWEQNETHIRHLILYLCKYKLLLLFCFFCFTGSSISINTREEINNKKRETHRYHEFLHQCCTHERLDHAWIWDAVFYDSLLLPSTTSRALLVFLRL